MHMKSMRGLLPWAALSPVLPSNHPHLHCLQDAHSNPFQHVTLPPTSRRKLKLRDLTMNTYKSTCICTCPFCVPSQLGRKKSPFSCLEIILPRLFQIFLSICGISAHSSRADRSVSSLVESSLMCSTLPICCIAHFPPWHHHGTCGALELHLFRG